MRFRRTYPKARRLLRRLLVLGIFLAAQPSCIVQKTPPSKTNQAAEAKDSDTNPKAHAIVNPSPAIRPIDASAPESQPKPHATDNSSPANTTTSQNPAIDECLARPSSSCVEPLSAEEVEQEAWANETGKRLERFLPKLNVCNQGLETDTETRIEVGLSFSNNGFSLALPIIRSTTSNCNVTACIKRVLKGLRTSKIRTKWNPYWANLVIDPRKSKAWTIAANALGAPFISNDQSRDNCTEVAVGIGGGMPPEVIQKIILEQYGYFRKCYEEGLAKDPNLCGKVQLRLVINKKGFVRTTRAIEGTNMTDCDVVQCVKNQVQELTFPTPSPPGEVTVFYPIIFQPG